MIKKIITTAVLTTALLMGASKMANADSMGVVKAKADHFAMVTTALKTEMELFIIMPDSHSLDKINNLYPKFANAVDEMDSNTMRLCKMDDSCNFYFEIGIENLDAIEYLQPKLIKAAQILDSQ